MALASNKPILKIVLIFYTLCFLIQPLYKLDANFYIYRVSAIIKVLGLCLFFGLIIRYRGNIKLLIVLVCMLGVFVANQVSFLFIFNDEIEIKRLLKDVLKGNIYYWIKYVYIFVVVVSFSVLPQKKELTEKTIIIFKYIILINTVVALIGFLLSIEEFKSYPKSPLRFGYNGLFNLSGEAIYFYIFSIILGYYEFIEKKSYFFLFVSIFGSLLLGKKAIILFLFLLLLIHLWYFKRQNVLYLTLGITISCTIFIRQISIYLINLSEFWTTVYNKIGLISTIFSRRDQLLTDAFSYMNSEWSLVNYLFGNTNFSFIKSEFGFFDLFLHLGILGFIVYVFLLYIVFFKNSRLLVKLIFLDVMVIEFFSGGLFSNILTMMVFFFLAEYFKRNTKFT